MILIMITLVIMMLIIMIYDVDNDVDNDYSDDHDYYPGVEVVGRLAAQGVDEEILKALVFIHGAAQVYIRYIRYISGIYQMTKRQFCSY